MIRNCDFCNKEYETKYPSVKFCSPECKMDFYVKRNDGRRGCEICGTEFSLNQIMNRHRFCNSPECKTLMPKILIQEKYGEGITNPGQIPEVKAKIKNTFKTKYGDKRPYFEPKKIINCKICSTPFKIGEFKFVCSKECLRKYYIGKNNGIDSCVICNEEIPFDSLKIKAKTCSVKCATELQQRTCEKIYGVRNAIKSPLVKAKIEATNLKRFGTKNSMQNKEVKNKAVETYLKNFGPNNPEAKAEMLLKRENTLKEKYGENYKEILHQKALDSYLENCKNNPNKRKEIYDKRKSTFLEKYNVEFKAQENLTNYENYNDEFILENFTKNGVATPEDLLRFKEYFNFSNNSNAKAKLTKLGIECNLERTSSYSEKRILKVLKENYPKLTFENNVWNLLKSPKTGKSLEIDILVKLGGKIICAIEYNGIFYHDKSNQEREKLKSELCEEHGFKLFHIWEDTEEIDLAEVMKFLGAVKYAE